VGWVKRVMSPISAISIAAARPVLSALVPASVVVEIEVEILSGGLQYIQNRSGAAKDV
jgi:hypothetical protein